MNYCIFHRFQEQSVKTYIVRALFIFQIVGRIFPAMVYHAGNMMIPVRGTSTFTGNKHPRWDVNEVSCTKKHWPISCSSRDGPMNFVFKAY